MRATGQCLRPDGRNNRQHAWLRLARFEPLSCGTFDAWDRAKRLGAERYFFAVQGNAYTTSAMYVLEPNGVEPTFTGCIGELVCPISRPSLTGKVRPISQLTHLTYDDRWSVDRKSPMATSAVRT